MMTNLKPLTVLKSVGPKLGPFFTTCAIFFVLYGDDTTGIFFCILKCLPIISLILFVVLDGLSLSEFYRYSRRILIGLIFSCIGNAFLVWKKTGVNFEIGLLMFAIVQIQYARAFGWRPLKPYAGCTFAVLGFLVYCSLSSCVTGMMSYLIPFYITLLCTMAWRAVARVEFYNDLWTWSKLCGFLGSMCFVVSDLTIAVDKFCFPVPFAHQIIMVAYYAAQLGISLSVVDSQVDELLKKTADYEQQLHVE